MNAEGRFTLQWLDTTLIAIWSFVCLFGLVGVISTYSRFAFPQDLFINFVSSSFLFISAIRLLHSRGRSGFIVPVSCAVCALIIHLTSRYGYMPYPTIGIVAGSIVNGMIVSLVAAFIPTFDDVWQRLKPYPREIKFRK